MAAQARPTREQVPVEQTWNLAHLYPSAAEWEADLAAVETAVSSVTVYRGRLGEGSAALLACLRAHDAFLEQFDRVAAYARLSLSVDGISSANQAMAMRLASLAAEVDAALSFIPTDLAALPDGVIERYLADEPALDTYRRQLEDELRRRPHVLSAETEAALAALGEALSAPTTIWRRVTTADLACEPVQDASGDERPVSIAHYVFGLSQSPDRELRRRAHESLSVGLARHKASLATSLATHIKRNVTLARLRRYDSAEEMILAPQRISHDVYRNVLDGVHNGMAPHYRRLMRLRQRVLGVDRLHRYDLEAPLDPGFDPPTTFAESGALIRAALAPLGEEYGAIIADAFANRWIDRADNPGKESGAFCAPVYSAHPYVFTTWQDNLRSTFVLAHELGHAGHMALAAHAQTISNVRPRLFFIEAPSTANELLLGRHILDTSDDPRLRRWVIGQFLATFTHNMITHMLEAQFERSLYELAEAGRPITVATVLDVQGEVFERFYDGTVSVDDADRLYWAQQPHFYVNLYPHTYAAGLACATSVVEAIGREGQPAVDRWLMALRAGGTLAPLELARLAGVDMASPEPIAAAVAFFGRLVDELEMSFA